jgi:steroid 5-alpha reductase family enzyme
MYAFGVFFHFASDMQKHISLQLRPGRLITTGLWSRCRNPNYFGELLIYLGFGLLAMHWAPVLVILLFLVIVWFPNMRKKDRSLSRYAEFAAYKKRTNLFIPFG